jgi:hypothetical protein
VISQEWALLEMHCLDGKHSLDFSFVFSAPLPAWRNLFSALFAL